MNDFQKLLVERHSIRRYTDQPISPDNVKTILEAALLAPSSKSKRPWQFVVVDDKEMLAHLAGCKPVAAHAIRNAAFAVVVLVNPGESDMYVEDAAIAAEFMQLQAAALGIGSCWIQVRDRYSENGEPAGNLIQQALEIPEYLKVECVMSFGYSAEVRRPVDLEKLRWEKVFIGKWEYREQ